MKRVARCRVVRVYILVRIQWTNWYVFTGCVIHIDIIDGDVAVSMLVRLGAATTRVVRIRVVSVSATLKHYLEFMSRVFGIYFNLSKLPFHAVHRLNQFDWVS